MKATIITIGDEILIGQIIDTNSAWIADKLNQAGIAVRRKMSVGDNYEDIEQAVKEAQSESPLVIITGGLGPTKDDITKKCLASVFGCGMRRDMPTYQMVGRMLESRGITFNELNQSQADVPEVCQVIPNINGTAPGMWFEIDGHVLVSLPGVPFEMKELMDNEVLPRIFRKFNTGEVVHKTVMTIGIPESVLAETLADWESSLPGHLKLAYLPGTSGIKLRLSSYSVPKHEAEQEIRKQLLLLEKIIPENLLGLQETTIEAVVAEILLQKNKTLAVAESCTGGAASSRFTAMAGASGYFKGGIVAYDNKVKESLLNVDSDDIERYGAVSQQVAEQMAIGVMEACETDYGISTTGVAGPDGGTEDKPVGTVWMAVASKNKVISQKKQFGNLRAQNIDRASSHVINMLRQLLSNE